MSRPRFLPDNFTLALLVTIALASFLPAKGAMEPVFNHLTTFAIGLLFFMHGAKLSRETMLAGLVHWRLHITVLLCTFLLFPVLTFGLKPIFGAIMTPDLLMGLLFLSLLPSTVQSSIAFTSIARGNVAAAICSATASNILGIFITPILVAILLNAQHGGGSSIEAVIRISCQLLLPFIAGQIARRWIGTWVTKHAKWIKITDQSSILLVVYTAFSEAVIEGLWQQLPPLALAGVTVGCCVLLALVLWITQLIAKKCGFNRADQITIIFCGSKKSLSSGIPMAKILFASSAVGSIVLPLMLFHQIQLMVCAVIAQKMAEKSSESSAET